MKKYRIDVDRMNGYQMLKYQVQVADVIDERAVDRARTTQIPGMISRQARQRREVEVIIKLPSHPVRAVVETQGVAVPLFPHPQPRPIPEVQPSFMAAIKG